MLITKTAMNSKIFASKSGGQFGTESHGQFNRNLQVTGKSERWGRDVIKKIKARFSKQDHQLVTIDEFCNYLGLDSSTVRQLLRN